MDLYKTRIFPNINTLGFYDPFKFKIQLNEFSINDFKNPDTIPYNKMGTFIHEMQHWVDHSSTLWGIKYLKSIIDSYHTCMFPSEEKLYKHRELNLLIARNHFFNYYTEDYNENVGTFAKRWTFRLTNGFRFTYDGKVDKKKPIPFLRFYDNSDKPICRQPISVSALLEATAIYSEYRFKLSSILKLQEQFRAIQLRRINKEFETLLYNSNYIIYSGIVHLTSNFLKLVDPFDAYKCSAIISKITLNLPQNIIDKIYIPKQCELPDNGSYNMLKNSELGYVYYLLLLNYSNTIDKFDFKEFTTDNILKASNLPLEVEILKQVENEISIMDIDILQNQNSLNNIWLDYSINCKTNIKEYGISQFYNDNKMIYTHRALPYISFNDSTISSININDIFHKINNNIITSLDEWENFTDYCEEKISGFNEICGI